MDEYLESIGMATRLLAAADDPARRCVRCDAGVGVPREAPGDDETDA